MSKTNTKPKTKNKALERKVLLEARIKQLEKLIPTARLKLAINDQERAFILEQTNKKFRNSRGKLQIPMVKTADTIEARIVQLNTELTNVKKHLGTRHLTKGSRVPSGYTWSYKPEPGKDYMLNPDYLREFDSEVQEAGLTIQNKSNPSEAEVSVNNEIQNPNVFKVDSSMSGKNIAAVTPQDEEIKSKIRQKAPADLAWVDIDNRAKGHTLVGADYRGSVGGKNSVANNKARLLLNRARDINRAYGGMNDAAKTKYLNNPITQLELEA